LILRRDEASLASTGDYISKKDAGNAKDRMILKTSGCLGWESSEYGSNAFFFIFVTENTYMFATTTRWITSLLSLQELLAQDLKKDLLQ
jgi:hypothetical protein